MEKKISFKEAQRLSILRWEALLEQEPIPQECKKLKCFCGFCERHNFNICDENHECNDCEFGKIAGKCIDNCSLYSNWAKIDPDDEPDYYYECASKILEVIKSLKENS